MQTTFSYPLKKPRTDYSFKSGVFDYAAIRKAAAPNPFGILPDKPPVKCSACRTTWYDNGVTDGPGCNGGCGMF